MSRRQQTTTSGRSGESQNLPALIPILNPTVPKTQNSPPALPPPRIPSSKPQTSSTNDSGT